MAIVELRFSALPEHVRTARLVASAVARKAGVDEQLLDEVRLAVGEACSRAVALHQRGGVDTPVRVELEESEKRFSIEVGDAVPSQAAVAAGDGGAAAEEDEDTGEMGLAVISGLVDDVEIVGGDGGGTIRMSWPLVGAPVR
ncbi:anti-sigma regulatory factor [Mangrovactinospora gilvigrisea]|uniref:Anti-sigma regulatory factor n=1 Tax=Mangrovactinospora gilvigrisea TaxID=1428644 RepID=A0A1J7BAQ2_9ACTN|nr:ATP-binding protein [Mangrovactinospora gilvigrisea]OIV35677.1 anti-sigma regulatory factor [Mangrovactinospora gilvigrisea]